MEYRIIAIGDELLLGQVTDTNSGSLARMLDPHGWRLRGVEVVHDDAQAITEALDRALAEVPAVLLTGGLGPTKDDITKGVLARYFGDGSMRDDAEVLRHVERVMSRNGRQMNELTRGQAVVPTCCRVIPNEVGTAPLMWFEKDGKVAVSMPGVPYETLTMMERRVLPMLLERFPSEEALAHRVAIVADLSESRVAMMLADWEQALPDCLHLAYLPKARLIRLRLDGRGADAEALGRVLDAEYEKMTALLQGHVIARADVSPAEALVSRARELGLTVGTAESCTGGNLAHEITLVAGCSDVMRGGVVSYANAVKEGLLGVRGSTLEAHGAVSEETVREMLQGAHEALGASLVMTTSGIAGPGGGSEEKPVGTVVIGASRAGMEPSVKTWHFGGSRARIIEQATTTALVEALHLMAAEGRDSL